MNKKWVVIGLVLLAVIGLSATGMAQQVVTNAPPAGAAPAKASMEMGFWSVVVSSGWLGIVLWIGLFASSIAAFALIIDSFVTVKEKKIAPDDLVRQVDEAMKQGDVMKALKYCEERPTPLANILSAGFTNVQEGYDVIQEIVGVTADIENEKMMQRITYLNVCANLAPMLGLLGTVQGMIYAFMTLSTAEAGAAQQAMLAKNIGQALWTTAYGLLVAIPATGFYTYFKNTATKIILMMETKTLDLIKSLRNVEVVEGEE
jgi:biopolymer transport protein ExbB